MVTTFPDVCAACRGRAAMSSVIYVIFWLTDEKPVSAVTGAARRVPSNLY
jgi:hypothetical protein